MSTIDPRDILASVADQMLEGVQVIGRDWRYLYANDTLIKQGKIPREKLLGRTMMECYPGIENTPLFAELRRCMGERIEIVFNNDFNFPDGSVGTFKISLHPVEQGILILSSDITAQDRTLMESIGDGVFAIDKDQRITLWNKAAEKITGWKSGEVHGKALRTVAQFLRNDDRTENMSFIDRALKGEQCNMENDTVVITKDGRAVPVGDSAAPIRDPQTGAVTGVIVVFRDMTDEYAVHQKERDIIKLKNDFLFKTIHDLRAPVNIVGLLVHQLTGEDSPVREHPDAIKMATSIQDLNDRMNRLIEDLFKIVKSEGQGFELQSVDVALTDCLRASIDEAMPLLQKRGISVELTSPPTVLTVSGDHDALREVFSNLIDNAVKYGRDGSKLHVSCVPEEGFISCAVRDEGIGIRPETAAKLFTPFYRGDARKETPGTGLGLYIVKTLVEKMGGSVTLKSVENEGTTITVRLPAA